MHFSYDIARVPRPDYPLQSSRKLYSLFLEATGSCSHPLSLRFLLDLRKNLTGLLATGIVRFAFASDVSDEHIFPGGRAVLRGTPGTGKHLDLEICARRLHLAIIKDASSAVVSCADMYGFPLFRSEIRNDGHMTDIPDNLGDRLIDFFEMARWSLIGGAVNAGVLNTKDPSRKIAISCFETLRKSGTKALLNLLDGIDIASANVASVSLVHLCQVALRNVAYTGRSRFETGRGAIVFRYPSRDRFVVDFEDRGGLSTIVYLLDELGVPTRLTVHERRQGQETASEIVSAIGDPMVVDQSRSPTRLHLYRLTDLHDRFVAGAIAGGILSRDFVHDPNLARSAEIDRAPPRADETMHPAPEPPR